MGNTNVLVFKQYNWILQEIVVHFKPPTVDALYKDKSLVCERVFLFFLGKEKQNPIRIISDIIGSL